MTLAAPSGEAVIACMRTALADARLLPGDIGYINAHASGTQLNDANECAAIRRVFGDMAIGRLGDWIEESAPGNSIAQSPNRHIAKCPPISGTKAFTAHPLGATGAMETAICALALHDGWLPPTLHHRTPDPACDLDILPNIGRARPIRYAMNNAFGFGGINAVLVLGCC